jgi:GH24 family phage-related lysozyme (muramidase)
MPIIQSNNKAFHDYLSWNEDRRKQSYLDDKGIPTVGVGFNLQRADARNLIESMGIDYDQLVKDASSQNKQITLSDPQIDQLLNITAQQAINGAAGMFPDYGTYDETRQVVIADLVFNMGVGTFSGFIKTIAAIKAQNWTGAASNLLWNVNNGLVTKTQYYKDVGVRARRNADGFATGNLPQQGNWNDPGENVYKPQVGKGPDKSIKESGKDMGSPKEFSADKPSKDGGKEISKDSGKELGKDSAPKEIAADKNFKEGQKEIAKDGGKEGGKDGSPKELAADKSFKDGGKDGRKDGKDGGKDSKDGKESKEGKDGKDGQKDGKDSKDGKEGEKDGKDGKDGKETKEGKDGKDGKETKEGKDGNKDSKDGKDGKETKEGKDGKETKEGKDGKETKEGKDRKDGKDGKEGKDNKEGKEGKDTSDKDPTEDVAFNPPRTIPIHGVWDDFAI